MISENKFDKRRKLAQQTTIHNTVRRMRQGFLAILNDWRKLAALMLLWLLLLLSWMFRHELVGYQADSKLAAVNDILLGIFLIPLAGALPLALSWAWGGPLKAGRIQDSLYRAGFVNAADEQPVLLSIISHPDNSNILVYSFYICGLALETWLNSIPKLEAALNRTIFDIRHGIDNQHFLVSTARPATVWPSKLIFHEDDFPSDHHYALALGEGLAGQVIVKLKVYPHILIGGSTGSGKTRLLMVMLHQVLLWGGKVFIADLKGGADFGRVWAERCTIAYKMDEVEKMLASLIRELERRKVLLRDADCSDIDELKAQTGVYLARLIFACDEVAAITDKTGCTKSVKDMIDRIISMLSLIAAQGRAFGLHLILSTQRPDADIVPGKIKSNIDFRVCGRADSVLSRIVLDSTAAADLVPKDAPGRFIISEGGTTTMFQAYMLPE